MQWWLASERHTLCLIVRVKSDPSVTTSAGTLRAMKFLMILLPDGANPLPELSAFREFGRDNASRVATPPVPTAADLIGTYVPSSPLGG